MTIRMVIGDRLEGVRIIPEQLRADGHPDWGDGTDCLNCGGGTKGTTN